MDKDEINKKIKNPKKRLDSLAGFEEIAENLVDHIYELFGRNTLLSILYQTGAGGGEIMAKRIKAKYGKEKFDPLEALEVLLNELRDLYAIQIRDIEKDEEKIRITIENRCYLRESMKNREKLKFGKAICRVNKGYFEIALRLLIGKDIEKIDINFLENDEANDCCNEELIFYYK